MRLLNTCEYAINRVHTQAEGITPARLRCTMLSTRVKVYFPGVGGSGGGGALAGTCNYKLLCRNQLAQSYGYPIAQRIYCTSCGGKCARFLQLYAGPQPLST